MTAQQKIVKRLTVAAVSGVSVGLHFLPPANPRDEHPKDRQQQQENANFGVVVVAMPLFVREDCLLLSRTQHVEPGTQENALVPEHG